MVSKQKFQELARKVPRSYEDFVEGIYRSSVNSGHEGEVFEFMKSHPEAQSDEVINYLLELEGDPDPLDVVNDNELYKCEVNWAIYRKGK